VIDNFLKKDDDKIEWTLKSILKWENSLRVNEIQSANSVNI
jgi:hypothetical protein